MAPKATSAECRCKAASNRRHTGRSPPNFCAQPQRMRALRRRASAVCAKIGRERKLRLLRLLRMERSTVRCEYFRFRPHRHCHRRHRLLSSFRAVGSRDATAHNRRSRRASSRRSVDSEAPLLFDSKAQADRTQSRLDDNEAGKGLQKICLYINF